MRNGGFRANRFFAAALAALCGAALWSQGAAAEEVRVYNWSDYIDESLLERFEKETGIKVVYDVFDSNEVLETKLLAGGSGYDVVVPSHHFLARQIQAGVFQPLDKSKLSNIGDAWSLVTERTARYDPGNAYSVNYMWGTTGVGYNTAKVREILGADAPTDSLAMLFDPAVVSKLAACGVHMLDAPTEALPAALRYIGEDPTTQDPAVLKKAEAVLAAIRPHIAKFHSSELQALNVASIFDAGPAGRGALLGISRRLRVALVQDHVVAVPALSRRNGASA